MSHPMLRVFAVGTSIGNFVAVGLIAFSGPVSAANEPVSFCHATSSLSNPFQLKTTDADSVIKQGHGSHTGPLFPADNWGDIIPPFDYSDGHFPGLNWPGGADILNGGCAVHEVEVPPEETTTTTTPPPPTTEATTAPTTSTPETTAATTTTTVPAGSPTTSTTPTTATAPTVTAGASTSAPTGGATTSAPPVTGGAGPTTAPPLGGTTIAPTPSTLVPPTTAPPSEVPPPVTEPPPGAPLPQVEAIVIDPGNRVVVLGRLTVPQVLRLIAEIHQAKLAQSGSDTAQLELLGILAILFGIGSVWLSHTRRRTAV